MKVGFDSGESTGAFSEVGNLPVYTTPSGVVIPIEIGKVPTALHADPSFEDPALADWYFGWTGGGSSVASNTSDTLEADRSLTVNVGATGFQIVESSVFAVTDGDTLEVVGWARAVSGLPVMSVGVLMATSGTPEFFDGATDFAETGFNDLTADFVQYRRTFGIKVVGAGFARIYFRVESSDALAAVARLDFTSSAVVGSTATAPA